MIRHHFQSEVWQPETLPGVSIIPSCRDQFSIKFQLFEVTRIISGGTEEEGENVTSEESTLVAERHSNPLSRVQLLSLRTRDKWLICTGTLTSMGVPKVEQPAIVEKILEALRVVVPYRPMCVVIKDIVTVQEDECVICLEDISNFGPKSVTPCSHIYHSECISKWQKQTQKKGHLLSCPMCRCEIPIAKMAVGEPSKPFSFRTLSLQHPQYQSIDEDAEDVVETGPPIEPSWCDGDRCSFATLLKIPLLFLSSCFSCLSD